MFVFIEMFDIVVDQLFFHGMVLLCTHHRELSDGQMQHLQLLLVRCHDSRPVAALFAAFIYVVGH